MKEWLGQAWRLMTALKSMGKKRVALARKKLQGEDEVKTKPESGSNINRERYRKTATYISLTAEGRRNGRACGQEGKNQRGILIIERKEEKWRLELRKTVPGKRENGRESAWSLRIGKRG